MANIKDYPALLVELFRHIRAQHRYEPEDWLGSDWDELNDWGKYREYRKAHSREHTEHSDYWSRQEWAKIKHPMSSRSARAKPLPMLDGEWYHYD